MQALVWSGDVVMVCIVSNWRDIVGHCTDHLCHSLHRLIVTTLILEDWVTWSAFNVTTIVTSYQDGDHLWSWLPPLSSLNLLIFSFNFNAKLPFANIWASFNCFFLLYYLISCLVQSGFSNFNELRLVRKIFVNFRPTLDCEHFDSPCLGFSPKLKLLRIGVGRIIINTVQPSSSSSWIMINTVQPSSPSSSS